MDLEQHHVINHFTGEGSIEERNFLVESARITRGEVKDINELNVDKFTALALPGGFGAAKSLCDFAMQGKKYQINQDLKRVCKAFLKAGKPAASIFIAPVLIPHIYPQGTRMTIGTDKEIAMVLSQLGASHQECNVSDIVVDERNKVISTPAYMLANDISQAAVGINKAITKLIELSK